MSDVSSAGKLFYPADGITKGDVVAHYRTVADVMVPHLRGRPLTLRRYPDGIDAEGWFQKEASAHFPEWLRTERVPQRTKPGEFVRHAVCDDATTLEYLASQATIEFHIWLSRVDSLDNPDLLVLDLDPADTTGLPELRDVARRARSLFAGIGLMPYLQTTGGRGFHIVTPLLGDAGFDEVRELAQRAAQRLAAEDRDRLTTAQRKDKRGQRIFLDTNRNAYGQTFVAPYSLRARPGAPVATPIDWSELGKTEPEGYHPRRIRQRLARKNDPWHDIHADAASAARALEKLS
ncbi:non-homologous end-joining DNA ligase [Prauserella oleivorans]|uniref:Non-homologous end-joining DNA ligase n=1 Tax=Prauserella oleivorans TaxID=1478153 RepID=A0ABW5WJD4_9PSEU